MGWFSSLFKGGGRIAGEAVEDFSATARSLMSEENAAVRRNFPPALSKNEFKNNGMPRKSAVAKHEAYTEAIGKVQPEASAMNAEIDSKRGISDLFKSSDGATSSIGGGAMIGGAFALGGSAIYGGAHMMSPNNSEVNNPIKNMVKGAFVGGVAGAAMLFSHNAAVGKNFTKAAGKSDASWWMKKAKEFAPGVKNAMNSPVTKGAIAAGLVAGSGQFDLTRPVNPVY